MFSKFFKSKTTTVCRPIEGKLIPLSEVPDTVFSKKLMGNGFAIKPYDRKLFSPIKGRVENIFPTKHAMIIKSVNGIETLIHIGIDTVDLAGQGIDLLVKVGQNVDHDVQLASIDLPFIMQAGKATEIIIVFPELKSGENVEFDLSGKSEILAELTD